MTTKLEHANMAVRDIDGMIRFLQTALPDFRIRGGGGSDNSKDRWVHVGNDDSYLALNQAKSGKGWKPYTGKAGVNHLGFEVDDAEALRARLIAGGYRESTVPNAHPHRIRVYFYDPEGNDWEFVQYLSDDPVERNDYELPDR